MLSRVLQLLVLCCWPITMWCTRWFLPLLLLPLPTAPAYFLVLFLFSLTLHAKPCFYCIVLLSTLFISSCYWQPVPLDTQLSVPWADNITTFAEALSSTLSSNYTQPLPSMIRPVDRCWCDFTSGGFFQPFNISKWEHQSVARLKDELERQEQNKDNSTTGGVKSDDTEERNSTSFHSQRMAVPFWIGRFQLPAFRDMWSHHQSKARPDAAGQQHPKHVQKRSPLSFPQQDYDLRPYGLDLIINFGLSSEP